MGKHSGKSVCQTLALIWFIVVVLSTLPLFASLFTAFHPLLDSLANIRIPLAFFTILLTFPLVFTKLRQQAVFPIIFAAALIGLSLNDDGVSPNSGMLKSSTFKLLQANLRFDNQTPEKFLTLIEKEKPDIITIQEASTKWREFFQNNNLTIIGCLADNDRAGATGVILSDSFLSRYSFTNSPVVTCYDATTTHGYIAKIEFLSDKPNRPPLDVISVHLAWPWPFGQNLQLDELENGAFRTDFKHKFSQMIVAGDFNSVTWSNTVSRMERLTGTRHISGIGATWLSYSFPARLWPYLGLPIDQILLSEDIEPISVKRLSFFGSDHLPVLVEISFNSDRF
ncbi:MULTISPECIES: endonuclease/exonuclease/phosphatase family protein [Bartonella]|uniref:endonuclease/exonuclease/phosphatase family protein n=1 Tax=Bartonella TaxID=773 RepID=UPI0018DCF163|nr:MULTISPECIES: endonuclease/exonuclease/phosphatase family protein [Bartonella]MBH9994773.1 endonuclease/exonuclease/phosphatase family protein [Bartonella sp. P0291]MBH9996882.1 endonuclease/exonuclease/phosphatase family protein [Bartonella sp. M0192]MBH9999042.1 endonuclease/exonuclease/phosphatase family protein [Bartonella sp. M0191]MBI0007422.1 endonuclease/exonuclease/phosphatase family protein [Bartonella sp. M0193]MBI0010333.1 endonuclease/exonuclease/phosphatase family protein [Bar